VVGFKGLGLSVYDLRLRVYNLRSMVWNYDLELRV